MALDTAGLTARVVRGAPGIGLVVLDGGRARAAGAVLEAARAADDVIVAVDRAATDPNAFVDALLALEAVEDKVRGLVIVG